MSSSALQPIDRPNVPPRPISPRLRTQLVYFAASADAPGVPALGPDEFYFPAAEVEQTVEDGVIYLVSPLDTEKQTEVEISEEQEAFLQWLLEHKVQHVRLVG